MSNDYLSLVNHPAILSAQSDVLLNSSNGNDVLMSAIFLQGDNPQSALEEKFAHFIGTETAILCQSGWCANTGLVQSIADEKTPVYIDLFAHMSLWEGIVSAKAVPRPFRHNCANHLEAQITKYGQGVVVIDSIYSTNGSLAPIKEIVTVAKRHGCIVVVDESHSLGTHGPQGRGLIAQLCLLDEVDFITASLAKAFAGRAPLITCSHRFSEYFRFTSRPAIFSSALLPFEIAGLSKTIDLIKNMVARRIRLRNNAGFLRNELSDLGYNVSQGSEHIIALESGTEPQTIILRDELEKREVFGSVFCAPATPKNRALVRLSVNSSLTMPQLRHIVSACKDIREDVELGRWSSTRRKHRTTDHKYSEMSDSAPRVFSGSSQTNLDLHLKAHYNNC